VPNDYPSSSYALSPRLRRRRGHSLTCPLPFGRGLYHRVRSCSPCSASSRVGCEQLSHHDSGHGYRSWWSSRLDARAIPARSEYRSRLPATAWRSCAGTYLHTTHHASIARICYPYHPFFGQSVESIRWLRHQTSDSLVIQLQDGLQLASPSWRLEPLACHHVSDAPVPCLSIEALLALRALLAPHPLLRSAIPTTPCVSQPEGARDAQESASTPTDARPLALPHPTHRAPAAHRQTPAMSRAHGPTAHPCQPQWPARGVSA
jgi:hypothetical protein